jgi:hypothetical protein
LVAQSQQAEPQQPAPAGQQLAFTATVEAAMLTTATNSPIRNLLIMISLLAGHGPPTSRPVEMELEDYGEGSEPKNQGRCLGWRGERKRLSRRADQVGRQIGIE